MTRRYPLEDVTVVDLGQIYNGPYATFLMAMAGARVIKIEPPNGDNMRRRGAVGGAMLPFAMLNSNKEFVCLNLKTEKGRELLREMAKRADVLLENFAPGVMDRLGLGPQALREINPRLIYAAGSGYGWSGPYRDYPAMDLTVQAMSGVMASTGFPDRPPVKAGPALCDFFGGVHLFGAVMTALYERSVTGEGRFVEVAMLEAVYASLSSTLGLYHGLGNQAPPRTGNRHGGLAESPYNVYPTKDGFLALICVSETHWQSLLDAMGRPEMKDRPGYGSLKERVARMDEIDAMVSAWTSGFAKEELFQLLNRHRVPCAPVRELPEVVHDPHMHARGSLKRVDHPLLGDVVLPTGPLRFEDAPPQELRPSKELGADSEAVLTGWLGMTPDAVAGLRREGVLGA